MSCVPKLCDTGQNKGPTRAPLERWGVGPRSTGLPSSHPQHGECAGHPDAPGTGPRGHRIGELGGTTL